MSSGISPFWHASYVISTPSPLHASVGTPADWARMVEPILSPRAAIAYWSGPTNRTPFGVFNSNSGSSGFSDACPHPGQTASTCARTANDTINCTLA